MVAEINGGKMLAETVATLDDEMKVDTALHIFAKSKASWYEIGEDETKYDEYPPYLSEFTPTD